MSRKHSIVDQRPWDDLQTSASTKTTTMTTAAKLYGKDLSEYEDVDVDELLAQLTPEEINILAKEVDPDVRSKDSYGIKQYLQFFRMRFITFLIKYDFF